MSAKPVANVDPYLTLKDVREVTKLGTSTIYRWMKAGTFPAGKHLTPNCVRWRASEIAEWQERHERVA